MRFVHHAVHRVNNNIAFILVSCRTFPSAFNMLKFTYNQGNGFVWNLFAHNEFSRNVLRGFNPMQEEPSDFSNCYGSSSFPWVVDRLSVSPSPTSEELAVIPFYDWIRSTKIELPDTTAIGIDDFAFRKGKDYGTLICDLNTHQPLAILCGRTREFVEAWLKTHPSIQTVSRDGSKTYREAITNTNPSIAQVSDRWHLIKNVKETLFKWLEQKLPTQIEWHQLSDQELVKYSAEKPIDEPKW